MKTSIISFKPYKGVSSNIVEILKHYLTLCFKPYKGVSSNEATAHDSAVAAGFKPYKGVSSNNSFILNPCVKL